MAPPIAPLSFWTALWLMAAGQGLFLAVAIATGKTGSRPARMLMAGLMFTFALTLFDYLGYWMRWHFHFPHFAGIYLWLALLAGPLFYLYLRTLAAGRGPRRLDILHALPALAMGLSRMPFYLAGSQEKVLLLMGKLPFTDGWWLPGIFLAYRGIAVLTIVHLSLYGWWASRLAGQQGGVRRRFFRLLTALYLGFTGAYLFYYLMSWTPWFSLTLDYSISLAMVVFIYTIGLLAIRQPGIFSAGTLRAALQPEKYRNSALTSGAAQSLVARLEHYMESERPYLESELRLPQLAEALSSNTHHLSQAINEHFGQTFSAYVNRYRVREAQRLLCHPEWQDRALIDIAYAAGFNNKTTFYKAFKEVAHQLPSTYRKRQMALNN